jgi:centromere-localized protein 2
MAPTEAQILETYLLRPAHLEAILTYEWFLERFPAHQRANPQIRVLWQDLVAQREKALQEVRASIEAEARRGQVMRREVLREKRQAEMEELDGEIELERAVRFASTPFLFFSFPFLFFRTRKSED